MKISKKTKDIVKKNFENNSIKRIERLLEYKTNYREQVITIIREIKGEQYLIDNAERLGYPEHQSDVWEIASQLDELIKLWFSLKSDNTEERLHDIIWDSIVRNSPDED